MRQSQKEQDKADLQDLETQQSELWSSATDEDLHAWAERCAGDFKEKGVTEQFFREGQGKRLKELVNLGKKRLDEKRRYKGVYQKELGHLENTSDRELGLDLQKAIKRGKTKDVPPLDKKE